MSIVFSPKNWSLQCLYSAFSTVFDSILPKIFSFLDSDLQRFTPICDCTVDTELIRWVNNLIQGLHIWRFSIVVNGVLVFPFSHWPTIQCACPFEHKMSCFLNFFTILEQWNSFFYWFVIITHETPFLLPRVPRNAQCPITNLEAYSWIFVDVKVQDASFSFCLCFMSFEDDSISELFLLDVGRPPDRFGYREESAMWWILKKSSIRTPLALHRFYPIPFIASSPLTIVVFSPIQRLIQGMDALFQDTPQSLRIHKSLPSRYWWPRPRSPGTAFPMEKFPNLFVTLLRCPIFVHESIFETLRTTSIQWVSHLYFWWNANCPSNLSQGKRLRSWLKT